MNLPNTFSIFVKRKAFFAMISPENLTYGLPALPVTNTVLPEDTLFRPMPEKPSAQEEADEVFSVDFGHSFTGFLSAFSVHETSAPLSTNKDDETSNQRFPINTQQRLSSQERSVHTVRHDTFKETEQSAVNKTKSDKTSAHAAQQTVNAPAKAQPETKAPEAQKAHARTTAGSNITTTTSAATQPRKGPKVYQPRNPFVGNGKMDTKANLETKTFPQKESVSPVAGIGDKVVQSVTPKAIPTHVLPALNARQTVSDQQWTDETCILSGTDDVQKTSEASPRLLLQQVVSALTRPAENKKAGTQTVRLQLVPKELGVLNIDIHFYEGGVKMNFQAAATTLQLLQDNAHLLKNDLNLCGWKMDSSAFSFGDQSTDKDPPPESDLQQQLASFSERNTMQKKLGKLYQHWKHASTHTLRSYVAGLLNFHNKGKTA